jgi:DNA modification methylase
VSWRILEGDCLKRLRELDAGSVQTCVTSPPYFGLRDYGHEGQIGLEPTPDEFVDALVRVFREVRRVLRDDGTVWLNLGDSFCSTDKWGGGKGGNTGKHTRNGEDVPSWAVRRKREHYPDAKPKDLLGIPWMVAFALRADGWYLRSDIIWAKPNPMPESVTDRPTKAHEYLFLLSKSPRYYYDATAIAEEGGHSRFNGAVAYAPDDRNDGGRVGVERGTTSRNRRSVWTVATQPFPGAHFATFPPKLIEPCVLAGSAPMACGECGAPWRRVTDGATYYAGDDGTRLRKTNMVGNGHGGSGRGPTNNLGGSIAQTVGWEATCEHEDDTGQSVVLDPFAGAGTTGLVATRHGRSFVGIELNPEYAEMARRRIVDDAPLLNATAEAPEAEARVMPVPSIDTELHPEQTMLEEIIEDAA